MKMSPLLTSAILLLYASYCLGRVRHHLSDQESSMDHGSKDNSIKVTTHPVLIKKRDTSHHFPEYIYDFDDLRGDVSNEHLHPFATFKEHMEGDGYPIESLKYPEDHQQSEEIEHNEQQYHSLMKSLEALLPLYKTQKGHYDTVDQFHDSFQESPQSAITPKNNPSSMNHEWNDTTLDELNYELSKFMVKAVSNLFPLSRVPLTTTLNALWPHRTPLEIPSIRSPPSVHKLNSRLVQLPKISKITKRFHGPSSRLPLHKSLSKFFPFKKISNVPSAKFPRTWFGQRRSPLGVRGPSLPFTKKRRIFG